MEKHCDFCEMKWKIIIHEDIMVVGDDERSEEGQSRRLLKISKM